jgi:hypothetical protein
VVPSDEDYIHWLTSKVGCLPDFFASINENFVSVVVEGVLAMAGGANSVHLESLRRVATSYMADILPVFRTSGKPPGLLPGTGGARLDIGLR